MGNLCICEAAASDVADPLLFGGQRPWTGDEVSIVRYPPLLESILSLVCGEIPSKRTLIRILRIEV